MDAALMDVFDCWTLSIIDININIQYVCMAVNGACGDVMQLRANMEQQPNRAMGFECMVRHGRHHSSALCMNQKVAVWDQK